MTDAQKLALRASEIRTRLAELAGIEEITDEQRAEIGTLRVEYATVETRAQAAIVAADEPKPVESNCQSHDVAGSPDPTTWIYRCSIGGPERTLTYAGVPAKAVVHLRYAVDPERPWRGYGPLGVALLAGRLSAETVAALADEVSGPRGTLLGVPVDGNDPTVEKLRGDIAGLKGKTALWQGGSDWGNEGTGGKSGMGTVRLGANPPSSLVELHKRATQEVYAACGLNPSIFESGTGTQARESYRQALFGTVAPLGRIVETELRNKLNDPGITIDWSELRAADIASRARAFQSMVGGGMPLDRAAALSGLMVPDDE